MNKEKLIIAGYRISEEPLELNNRKYLKLMKDNQLFFYRIKNNNYVELDKQDQKILFDYIGDIPASPPKNTKVLIRLKQGLTAIVLLSSLLTLKSSNYAAPKSYIDIPLPISYEELQESKPVEPVVVMPDELREDLKLNHQIIEELKPFFEIFTSFMADYFADYKIGKETKHPINFIIDTEEFFKKTWPYAAAVYLGEGEIHFRTIEAFLSTYHELVHDRTSYFGYKYGRFINEALTQRIPIECFGISDNSINQNILKVFLETIGYDNIILPFIDGGSIDDVINAIDEETKIPGLGRELIDYLDVFSDWDVYEEASTPTNYLAEAEIKLIDFYFHYLNNRASLKNFNIEEIIQKAFDLECLLATDENTDVKTQTNNLELYKVRNHYENLKNKFLDDLIKINSEYESVITTLSSSYNIAERKQYFTDKGYIYHGEYTKQYYVRETIKADNTKTIWLEELKVPQGIIKDNQTLIHLETKLNEDGLIISQNLKLDNIDNYKIYQEIANYSNQNKIYLKINDLGFITSAQFTADGVWEKISLEDIESSQDYYDIAYTLQENGSIDKIKINIKKEICLNPENANKNVTIKNIRWIKNNESSYKSETISITNISLNELDLFLKKLINMKLDTDQITCDFDSFGYLHLVEIIQNNELVRIPLTTIGETAKHYKTRLQQYESTIYIHTDVHDVLKTSSSMSSSVFSYSYYNFDEEKQNYIKTDALINQNLLEQIINKIIEVQPNACDIEMNANLSYIFDISYFSNDSGDYEILDLKTLGETSDFYEILHDLYENNEKIHLFHSNALLINPIKADTNILYFKYFIKEDEEEHAYVIENYKTNELNSILQNVINNYPNLKSANFTLENNQCISSITVRNYLDEKSYSIPLSSVGNPEVYYFLNQREVKKGKYHLDIDIRELLNYSSDSLLPKLSFTFDKVEEIEGKSQIVESGPSSINLNNITPLVDKIIQSNNQIDNIYCIVNEMGFITNIIGQIKGEDYPINLNEFVDTTPHYTIIQTENFNGTKFTYKLHIDTQDSLCLNLENVDQNVAFISEKEIISEKGYPVRIVGETSHTSLNPILKTLLNEYPDFTNFRYNTDYLGNIYSIEILKESIIQGHSFYDWIAIPLEDVNKTTIHYEISDIKKSDGSSTIKIIKKNVIQTKHENESKVTYITNDSEGNKQYEYLDYYDLDIEMLDIISNYQDASSIIYYLDAEGRITHFIIVDTDGQEKIISFLHNIYQLLLNK